MKIPAPLLILAILLPALCILITGFLFIRDWAGHEKQAQQTFLRDLADEIQRQFRRAEGSITERVGQYQELNFDHIRRDSDALSQEQTLLKRFLVFSKTGLASQPLRPEPYSAIRDAQKQEFAERDLSEALRMYQAELNQAVSAQQGFSAQSDIARIHFKAGRWEESIDADTQIAQAVPTVFGAFPLQVGSHLRIAEAYLSMDRSDKAIDCTLRLLKKLAMGLWPDPGGFSTGRAESLLARLSDEYSPSIVGGQDSLQQIRDYRSWLERLRDQVSQQAWNRFPGKFIYTTSTTNQLIGTAVFEFVEGQTWVALWVVDSQELHALLELNTPRNVSISIVQEAGNLPFERAGTSHPAPTVQSLSTPPGWSIVSQAMPDAAFPGDPRIWLLAVSVMALLLGLLLLLREMRTVHMQQEFISSVSHELRKPLNNLKCFLGMVEDTHARDEVGYANWQWANGALNRLQNMLENVLSLAQLRHGRFRFSFQTGPLEGVVESALADFLIYTEEEGFKLRQHIADELPEVRFDANALHLVIMNLLDNALKYSKARRDIPEKRIDVSVYPRGAGVAIEVADKGIGIHAENQNRVFRRFYREPRELPMPAGTGLGLAIAQKFIAAHRGSIEVESAPMQGSCFRIWLPQDEL